MQNYIEFQFLIGNLRTAKSDASRIAEDMEFQFLIGNLRTILNTDIIAIPVDQMFQFLIGNLRTVRLQLRP